MILHPPIIITARLLPGVQVGGAFISIKPEMTIGVSPRVCASDYFQGSSKSYAAIPLPWSGTGDELQEAVEAECDEMNS